MSGSKRSNIAAQFALGLGCILLTCGCPPREAIAPGSPQTQAASALDKGNFSPDGSKPAGASQPHPATSSAPGHPGLIYVFPGIEGNAFWLAQARRGYRDAGVQAELRQFDWGRPLNSLANLTDLEGNRKKAALVAAELTQWRAENPDAPLDMVAYSGGGGMALLTLELLPPAIHVRNVVLVQPATSPTYDLMPALAHVDGRMTHFYSPSDVVILGWGTTTFGTSDRWHGPAAGKTGFDIARAIADGAARARFVQTAWSEAWRDAGHSGDHVSMLGYRWNRDFVAPALLLHEPEIHAGGF